jgi:hypothetical protein
MGIRRHNWCDPCDLALNALKPGGRFVFARTVEEKEKLCDNVDPDMPIVVLDA